MATVTHLVQGNTMPNITAFLYDEQTDSIGNITKVPIDLTDNLTVVMNFRAVGSTAVTVVSGTAVSPYSQGRVQFSWPVGTLAGPAGNYEGEIVLTQQGGGVFTVFDLLKFKVRAHF